MDAEEGNEDLSQRRKKNMLPVWKIKPTMKRKNKNKQAKIMRWYRRSKL